MERDVAALGHLKELFERIDIDKDGCIAKEGVVQLVEQLLGYLPTAEELETLMNQLEKGPNGTFRYTDIEKGIIAWLSLSGTNNQELPYSERLQQLWRVFDPQGIGSLSFTDFGNALRQLGFVLSEDELHRIAHQLDLDQDGRIGWDEWIHGMEEWISVNSNHAARLLADTHHSESEEIVASLEDEEEARTAPRESVLTRAAFQRAAAVLGHERALAIVKAFDECDGDGDGVATVEQVKQMLVRLGLGALPGTVQEALIDELEDDDEQSRGEVAVDTLLSTLTRLSVELSRYAKEQALSQDVRLSSPQRSPIPALAFPRDTEAEASVHTNRVAQKLRLEDGDVSRVSNMELESLRARCAFLETQIQEAEREHKKLQQQLADRQVEADVLRKSLRSLDGLKDKVVQLSEEAERLKAETGRAKEAEARWRRQCAKLQEECVEMEGHAKELLERLCITEALQARTAEQLHACQTALAEARKAENEARIECQEHKEQAAQASHEAKQLKAMLNSLKEANHRLQVQVADDQAALETTQAKLLEMKKVHQEYVAAHPPQLQSGRAAEGTKHVTTRRSIWRTALDSAGETFSIQHELEQAVQKEKESLQTSQMTALQTELEQLRTAVATTLARCSELEQEKAHWEETIRTSNKTIASLQEELKSLSSRPLGEMKETGRESRLETIPVEQIVALERRCAETTEALKQERKVRAYLEERERELVEKLEIKERQRVAAEEKLNALTTRRTSPTMHTDSSFTQRKAYDKSVSAPQITEKLAKSATKTPSWWSFCNVFCLPYATSGSNGVAAPLHVSYAGKPDL